jgi:hypothetical protein
MEKNESELIVYFITDPWFHLNPILHLSFFLTIKANTQLGVS